MNIMLFALVFVMMPFIVIYKLLTNIIYLPYDIYLVLEVALKSENIHDMMTTLHEEAIRRYEKMTK